MSESDIKAGSDFGRQIIPLLSVQSASAENSVHFWAGFFGSISGAAGADIGADAIRVISEATQEIVSDQIKSHIKVVE